MHRELNTGPQRQQHPAIVPCKCEPPLASGSSATTPGSDAACGPGWSWCLGSLAKEMAGTSLLAASLCGRVGWGQLCCPVARASRNILHCFLNTHWGWGFNVGTWGPTLAAVPRALSPLPDFPLPVGTAALHCSQHFCTALSLRAPGNCQTSTLLAVQALTRPLGSLFLEEGLEFEKQHETLRQLGKCPARVE